MGHKFWLPRMICLLLMLLSFTAALACQSGGSHCSACIANQMKTACPRCFPIMHCMAECLWGGSSRSNCIKKCDCNGGYPRLADCKKCLQQCKCSCST